MNRGLALFVTIGGWCLPLLSAATCVSPPVPQREPPQPTPPHSSIVIGTPAPVHVERLLNAVPFQNDRSITKVFFADGGRTLLTCCDLGIRAWDHATQKLLRELPNHTYISASRDASRLAVIMGDNRNDIFVIEWPSGDELMQFEKASRLKLDDDRKFSGILFTGALSPDGSQFAAVYSANGFEFQTTWLRIWDVKSGNVLADKKGPGIPAICWTPDGKFLAVGRKNGTVNLMRPDGTTLGSDIRFDANPDPDEPLQLAFDVPGKRLAVLTTNGSCSVWNVADRSRVWEWRSPQPGKWVHTGEWGGLTSTVGASGCLLSPDGC